ncbi:MAG: hypothetical protein E6Q06_04665 [Candidatus Moraniibacteriota bacterium]|nr:MAG: hypothetical protein E6Q06_04665 [Candidatus Moranbacteria bacterium]
MIPSFSHRRLDDLPFFGLAAALIFGLVIPSWFVPYYSWTSILLQFIFFTSGLKIDLHSVLSELRDRKLFVVVASLRLVIFPIFVLVLTTWLSPGLVAPLVLLAAMPAGMTSPLFVDMIRGNVPLALLLTAGTSLLSVVTLPLILGSLNNGVVTYAPWTMFQSLFFVMAVPIALAQLVRFFSFGREIIRWGGGVMRAGSVLSLWLLVAAIASRNSESLKEGFSGSVAIEAFAVMTVLFVLFHGLAYVACFWRSKKDRITVTLALSYMNFTLAIFLAETLFRDTAAILVVILSMLPWNMGLLVFQWLIRHNHWTIEEIHERK